MRNPDIYFFFLCQARGKEEEGNVGVPHEEETVGEAGQAVGGQGAEDHSDRRGRQRRDRRVEEAFHELVANRALNADRVG
jgi:hypothetical protein